MFRQKYLLSLWVILCIISTGLSQDSMTPPGPNTNKAFVPGEDDSNNSFRPTPSPGEQKDGMAGSEADQKPPVWLQCMADSTGQDVSNSDIKGVFETWCSNYESMVQCLTTNLPPTAQSNPFDFFISLGFDPDRLRESSKDFCGKLKASSGELSCSSKQNETLAAVCGHGFTRGLFHIFGLFKEKNAPPEALSQIACDVTTQTTFCLRQSLLECPSDVQTTLLNYYALFTNDTCVAGDDYQPPSPQQKRPDTVVVKCADEAAQTLTADQSDSQPTSIVDFVVLGLKTDCKTYPARFSCYDRELRNITNFLDFWLSLTFDLKNALASQEIYCGQIGDMVIPRLTTECFNQSQPALAACESGFGQEVETIRREWVQNPDFDAVQLQTLACRTSVTRATCLGDAMKHCGEEVARAMAVSEMGILPDVCRQLLAKPKDQGKNDDMDKNSNSRNEDSMRGGDEMTTGNRDVGGMNDRPTGGMGYKEHRNINHHNGNNNNHMESGDKMKGGRDHQHTAPGNHIDDNNNNNNNNGEGVGNMVCANCYVVGFLLSFFFVFILL